jgi:hypothetical protein
MEGVPQPNARAAALVTRYYETLSRGPYGTKDALQEMMDGDVNSMQRIIHDVSENAWVAYCAAKKATMSEHGFSGKAELARALDNLNPKSTDDQRIFAEELAYAIEAIQTTGKDRSTTSKDKSSKRRRTHSLHDIHSHLTELGTAIDNHVSIPSTPSATSNGLETNHHNINYYALEQPGSVDFGEDVHVDASLSECKTLFPAEFMASIQRRLSKREPNNYSSGRYNDVSSKRICSRSFWMSDADRISNREGGALC